MTETDLQLGGGYTYQWECAILLALNYFFDPVRYNPTLFDLVEDFLGQVAEIHLEGEDQESGVDLEDITLVNGDRRILIQVKTKQAEGARWTPTDPLLLKALYRFYDSRFFAEQPDNTRFVFLTNRPFNRTLVRVKSAISEGTVAQCAEAVKLRKHLDRYARKEKKESVDAGRFREMLARTALVEYLAVDEVKANVQAKLQAQGRRDWEQAHAVLFEHFARQSTRIGGGTVTRESVIEVLGPPLEVTKEAALTPEKRQGLTRTYLGRVADDCLYVEPRDLKIPLTEVFVMLQAVERRREEPLREDFAPLEEREREVGFLERIFTRRKPGEVERVIVRERPAPPPPPAPVELSKALQEHDHLVLLGEPGVGKTTTLKYIALLLAKGRGEELGLDGNLIPVRLNLGEEEHRKGLSERRLDEFLKDRLHEYYISPEQADAWLEEGRLILLFDALDEVRPEERQREVLKAIGNFASKWKGTRIILSSRLPVYRATTGIGGDFGHYIICPFTKPEEALPYAANWFAVLEELPSEEEAKARAQKLLGEMQKQPGLRRVMSNPLLLRLAIEVYLREGEIVSSRAELYKRYIEETRKRARLREDPSVWKVDIKTEQEEREALETALETIAWKIFVEGEYGKEVLCRTVEEKLMVNGHKKVDGTKLVEYLRSTMGLLILYLGEREEEFFLFSHFSFCEYFVALHLGRCWRKYEKRTWRFWKPRLHHPFWREPITLLAGLLDGSEATKLVCWLLRAGSPYERFLHRDLFLAAALIGHGAEVEKQITKRVYCEVARLLSKYNLREQAAEALVEMGKPAVPYLIAALEGKDSDVREAAADALGELKAQEAVPHLIAALRDRDEDVRWAAVGALWELKAQEAVPHLIAALGDGDSNVREVAAKALGEIGSAEAVPHLIAALGDEHQDRWGSYPVREAAADALGELKAQEAVPHLIAALYDEYLDWMGYYSVYEAVTEALSKIGSAEAVLHLIAALGDGDSNVRRLAADALGKLKAQEAVPYLIADLEDENNLVRRLAADALGKLKAQEAVPRLIAALGDSNVREVAAKALGEIGSAEAVPHLIAALGDEHRDRLGDARVAAADALGKLKAQEAVPHLIAVLGEEHRYWSGYRRVPRQAAAKALGEIGNARAVPHLLVALGDENSDVRVAAAEALGELKAQEAVPHLIAALRDKTSDVQEEEIAQMPLILRVAWRVAWLILGDKNVREAAADALGKLKAQEAVPHLIAALRDRDENVRWAAVGALWELKAQESVPHLIAALGDKNSDVREVAAEALEELVGEIDLSQARYLARVFAWGPLPLKPLWLLPIRVFLTMLRPPICIIRFIFGFAWAHEPLSQVVSRITEIEVADLPAEDPYTMPGRSRWGHLWPYFLYVALAALGGLLSDLVAGALGERFELGQGWRLGAVGAAFVLVLAAGVAVELFWRGRTEGREPPG